MDRAQRAPTNYLEFSELYGTVLGPFGFLLDHFVSCISYVRVSTTYKRSGANDQQNPAILPKNFLDDLV